MWRYLPRIVPAAAATVAVVATATQSLASEGSTPNRLKLFAKRVASSPELAHFMKFASTEVDGELCMTPNDFFLSIGIDNPEKADLFKAYFDLADRDQSGFVSFSEYSFFSKLLSTENAEFELAFQIFDLKGDGKVTKDEFEAVMSAHTSEDFSLANYQGLEERFFGEDGKAELDYEKFVAFLSGMKTEVLKVAFQQHVKDDPEGRGRISTESLVEIITKSVGTGKTKALAHHMRSCTGKDLVTFDEFLTFQQLCRDLPHVERIMELYTMTGGRIGRDKFMRVFKMQQPSASASEVDLLFSMFAEPTSKALDKESFLAFLEATDETKPLLKMSLAQSLSLGGASAMIGASVVFPIDKVKTLMQSTKTTENPVRAMVSTFRNVIQSQGVRGMYRGLAPQLIGVTPEKALKLTVNDRLRRLLRGEDESRELRVYEEMLAGCGTGMFQVFVTNPVELVKIRLQMQGAAGGAERKSMAQVIREAGVRGLYTGLPATMLRDIPFNIIYFSSYAFFKKSLRDERGTLGKPQLFACGFGAGALAAALDTPADTIKTRLQNGQGKYRGVVHCFSTILREEGWGALFRGTLPRVMIIGPMFSITFAMFEFFQSWLLPQHEPPAAFRELSSPGGKERLLLVGSAVESNYGIRL